MSVGNESSGRSFVMSAHVMKNHPVSSVIGGVRVKSLLERRIDLTMQK